MQHNVCALTRMGTRKRGASVAVGAIASTNPANLCRINPVCCWAAADTILHTVALVFNETGSR